MALQKLGQNKWQIKVSVRVQGKDNPVKKQEVFEGTKTEAECRKAEIINEIRNSASSLKSEIAIKNISEFLDLFVEKRGLNFSDSHKCKVDFVKSELGHLPIDGFPAVFEQYLKVFRETPVKRTRKQRSCASVNRYVEIVRAAFTLAFKLGLIEKNPITPVRFPKLEEKPRDVYLTEGEELRLIDAIKIHRPYLLPFVNYSMKVPCRKSELTKAKKEQYNQFTNTIYIPDSKTGEPIHKPVPEEMIDYFRSIPADCPYLFYRKDKDGYQPLGDFKKAWQYCLLKADLKNYRVHDLRHRAVTTLIEFGNNENMVADVAGWKSTKMLKNYRKINTLKSAQAIKFSQNSKPNLVANSVI